MIKWLPGCRRARIHWAEWLSPIALSLLPFEAALSTPYVPANDAQVLAQLPAGSLHTSSAVLQRARTRADVALPLAQFYISRARASGDLRYLGYAEGMLAPYLSGASARSLALVLDATVLQSRHAFSAALTQLDHAIALQPDNAQAWLTRATILRVLGRYPEAMQSCERLGPAVDPAITQLCEQSLRALTGDLHGAYATLVSLPQQTLPREVRAWRYSELGEMAERGGDDAAAEHWLLEGLALAPEDFYMRTAYADLLLRQHRAAETLRLLSGCDSMEPLLLRMLLAQQMLGDHDVGVQQAGLEDAFAIEERRGEAVHRREQARFLLDIEHRPAAALAAAQENWRAQREPDDVLILLRTAQAARRFDAVAPVMQFLAQEHLQDSRLEPYLQIAHP
ncbi:MAG: tetratricopeptide repeat protein [Steroidobacteraceae bacterium]|jgi:tetratricopeptide (TPR) repeat protein